MLTFALSIGGLTIIFSLVNAVLLRPLPYPESDRLMSLMEADKVTPVGGYSVAAPNFFDWEQQATSFESMALYEYLGYNISGDGEPEQVQGLRTTHKLFDVLGVPPMLGRGFVAGDDAGANGKVVVISHGLWQRRFGGDSAIIGQGVRIKQEPWQVIGVMPKGFGFPNARQAVWTPIALNEEDRGRGSHSFFVVSSSSPASGSIGSDRDARHRRPARRGVSRNQQQGDGHRHPAQGSMDDGDKEHAHRAACRRGPGAADRGGQRREPARGPGAFPSQGVGGAHGARGSRGRIVARILTRACSSPWPAPLSD